MAIGDCTIHNDCRGDSVCVQDPTQPLGPCIGDPQGADVYAADPTTGRAEWTFTRNMADYCVPACSALLEDQQHVRDTNEDLSESYFLSFCPEESTGGGFFGIQSVG